MAQPRFAPDNRIATVGSVAAVVLQALVATVCSTGAVQAQTAPSIPSNLQVLGTISVPTGGPDIQLNDTVVAVRDANKTTVEGQGTILDAATRTFFVRAFVDRISCLRSRRTKALRTDSAAARKSV